MPPSTVDTHLPGKATAAAPAADGRLRILFATHDYPFPVTYGGQVYSGNIIRELARIADVSVHCLHPGIAGVERFEAEGARWTRGPLPPVPGKPAQLLSSLPVLAIKHVDAAYWQRIADELTATEPDVLIVDYIAIGWIAEKAQALIRARGLKTAVLYMSHNVETLLRQQIAANYRGNPLTRLLARYDSARAGRLEARLAATDFVSVETEEDEKAFETLFHPRLILMAPPGYAGEVIEHRTVDTSVPRNVAVLGGRLSTMKQIVLDELLDVAAARVVAGGTALHVIGPMSEQYLTATRARYPAVDVHGFVDDVKPLLAQMRAGIVADHVGGGFKHRILTYVFYRVPMIAVPEAMAGLPLTPGEDYHPVSSYEAVPDAIAALIDDVERLDAYQNRAFERCRSAFSWSETVNRFARDLAAALPVR